MDGGGVVPGMMGLGVGTAGSDGLGATVSAKKVPSCNSLCAGVGGVAVELVSSESESWVIQWEEAPSCVAIDRSVASLVAFTRAKAPVGAIDRSTAFFVEAWTRAWA